MSMSEPNSSQLQAEVERQREKLSADIDRLAERLTPGRMLDEVLARTKNGGGEFLSNLGHSATANPVPVALLGVSLAWLMARSGETSANAARRRVQPSGTDGRELPLASVTGKSIRRVAHEPDASGQMWAHFSDESGRRFKAKSDSLGRRAGHFIDDAGKSYRGFVDSAGEQIASFQDEAGVALDDLAAWAADTWSAAGDAVSDATDAVRSGTESVARRASEAGDAIGDGARRLNDTIASAFVAQPLVAGALAFAVGAAIAASLPHTEMEDEFLGDPSDDLKEQAGEQAEQAYADAKEKVSEVYSKVNEAVAPVAHEAGAEVHAGAPEPRQGL